MIMEQRFLHRVSIGSVCMSLSREDAESRCALTSLAHHVTGYALRPLVLAPPLAMRPQGTATITSARNVEL